MSPLHDAFLISQPKDSLFVKINGLRPCSSPGEPVEIPEIDAAWGQASLLLYTMGRELGYMYTSYIPLPFGSTSKFKCCSDNRLFELCFSSGRLPVDALRAFMCCLKELSDWIVRECSTRGREYVPVMDIVNITCIKYPTEARTDDILDRRSRPDATNKVMLLIKEVCTVCASMSNSCCSSQRSCSMRTS